MRYTIAKDKRNGYNVLFGGVEMCNRKTIEECEKFISENKNINEIRTPINKHNNY